MPIRHLWVQFYRSAMLTQAGIDALIALCKGQGSGDNRGGEGKRITDLLVPTRTDDDARTLFRATLTEMRPERINSLPVGSYLIQAAHAAGIRVHAWALVGWFGTYASMRNPPPNNYTMPGDPAWVNFSLPEMRQRIVDYHADIMAHSDLDGLHADYLRLSDKTLDSPSVTTEHVTEVLRGFRRAIGTGPALSATFSGRGAEMARQQRRDVWTWLSEDGLVDHLHMMSYLSVPLEDKRAWLEGLPNATAADGTARILPGIPTFRYDESGQLQPDATTFAAHCLYWTEHNHPDLAIFDSHTLTRDMVDRLPAGEAAELKPKAEPAPNVPGCLAPWLAFLRS